MRDFHFSHPQMRLEKNKKSKKKNFDNRPGSIWLDGRFIKWNKAQIHAKEKEYEIKPIKS